MEAHIKVSYAVTNCYRINQAKHSGSSLCFYRTRRKHTGIGAKKIKKAVKMNISVIRAFIALRQFAIKYKELADHIIELKESVGNHNDQLKQIYDTLENLPDEKVDQKSWQNREPIGVRQFKK